MPPLRSEVRRLLGLALPVVAAQVGFMLQGVVDTIMVGRLSTDALAAASMANVWVHGTWLLGNGILMGMDPLVAKAHGAGRGADCGLVLQRALVLSLLLVVPMAGLWLVTGPFLAATGQAPRLVDDAHRYAVVQIPSLPFAFAFVALRQYLQGREIMRPAMWVMAGANLFNVVANWALIFGHLGSPPLGLFGAGIATALSRVVMFVLLAALVLGFDLHQGAWTPWTRQALSRAGLRGMLALGLPVGVQMGLEIWAFSGATLFAGWLGAEALAAHTVALNLAALAFMVPLGISQGAATRVGNLLGAHKPQEAQRAAWVAMSLGAGVMAASGTLFVLLRGALPRIYTEDPGVVAAAAAILPIAAAFAIFDGAQVVGCGVLRGMGNTRPAAVYNLLAYWVVGLPLGLVLAFRVGVGLGGIWWGLALGLALVAGLLVLRLRVRGPASLPLEPIPEARF